MRVFLDANVLFSAAKAGSSVARLVGVLTDGSDAVTSPLAVLEARRNLSEKMPGWLPEFDGMLVRVILVPEASVPLAVELVAKDRPILEAAVNAACTHFVTSDRRHFGHLYGQIVHGVKVVSLVGMAEDLARSGRL